MCKENIVYGIVGFYEHIITKEKTEARFTNLYSTKEEAESTLIDIDFDCHTDEFGTYFTKKACYDHPEFDIEHYVVEFALPKKTNGEIENEK